MKKRACFIVAILSMLSISAALSQTLLEGYGYGLCEGPSGNEWQSPQELSLNKEQPHAWFFDFANEKEAREVLPYHSTYWQSLNGTWKFHWAPNPDERPQDFFQTNYDVTSWDDLTVPGCWNVQGIQKDGSLKYGVPIYCNQPVIFKHSVAVDDWKGGVMREPAPDWTTYKYRNEVGSYRRTFSIPASWKDKEIYLDFDGVNSFFYLWINGKYVGFSKNSRTTASFDITSYITLSGDNTVAVEVYRNSDGSFLEAQDMWRLPGIYRSVALHAKNKTQVRDIVMRTTSLGDILGKDIKSPEAEVKAELWLSSLNHKDLKGLSISYSVYQCKLWEDENTPVKGLQNITLRLDDLDPDSGYFAANITIPAAKYWSSEAPYRYIFVGNLKDRKGHILETFSTYFGIRKVEIRDTPAEKDEFGLAGRYFYINDKPVKLKGVNRQEICLESGNTITHDQIQDEIMLMRRGNINHVRTSHYANDPFWFYACDKYGIYLEDEANIESHEYYYGKASLSHVPEFRAAHVARVMESVHAHVNSPSVVIWSLGNEAGPGQNFKAAYNAVHTFDPSRPVQYERNNDIVDMGSNQYPSIEWTREAVRGQMEGLKYPFHISEYAHSMGNAGGDLKQYWEAIESTNFFCGGAIWDWVDQALWNYDSKSGTRYMAYGGDFGDKPNDGMFCMNGILYPDHTPKPEFEEVKKVYQYYSVKLLDAKTGRIEVFNKNYFTPMTDVYMVWSLYKDGIRITEPSTAFIGAKSILGPRGKKQMTIPYDTKTFDPRSEYYVRIQFLLGKDMPWAKQGYVQAEEEFLLQKADKSLWQTFAHKEEVPTQQQPLATNIHIEENADQTILRSPTFTAIFNNADGSLYSLSCHGHELIAPGNGPQLSVFRAPVDNDNWGGARSAWATNGLPFLHAKAQKRFADRRNDGAIVLSYSVELQSPLAYEYQGGASGHNAFVPKDSLKDDDFKLFAEQIWTIYSDGTIELESGITSNEPEADLARCGYLLKLDKAFSHYTYYGRGPRNNYNDRCSGSMTALYESTVAEQFEPFPKPQDMGNREDVRWCALTDDAGMGLQFIATNRMSASALPYSDMQLTLAAHPYQLPVSDGTYLHLDAKVTGLGGNSCGQGGPLKDDCTKATARTFGFIIRPVEHADKVSLSESAKVQGNGELPICIERDRQGLVSISCQDSAAEIHYTVTPLSASSQPEKIARLRDRRGTQGLIYEAPFSLRSAARITAWREDNPQISSTKTFPVIETVPLTVVYASSEEPDYGEAENLVDGDPETVWFTTYSVTVAQFPHWVDFDANDIKTIKGFTYLPIADSKSGNLLHYKIYVSQDGKDWGDPVITGEFPSSYALQRVLFEHPVKGRFIRLMGIDSQNGRDYGGGAEFNILVEE